MEDVTAQAHEIATLMGDRLGARGETLAARLRHSGRLLPRRIAREARYLAEAEAMIGNRRLLPRIEPERTRAAHDRVAVHLRGIDPKARRITRWLGIAAVIAFDLIIIAILLIVVLVWRGFV